MVVNSGNEKLNWSRDTSHLLSTDRLRKMMNQNTMLCGSGLVCSGVRVWVWVWVKCVDGWASKAAHSVEDRHTQTHKAQHA